MFELTSDAVISPCGHYRYLLRRELRHAGEGACLFVMLNPSTADATHDDRTIRRCMGFARDWGYRWLHVVNLFAWRATAPEDMFSAEDPIGPENNRYLNNVATGADLIICAWGKSGSYRGRALEVMPLFARSKLHVLALNKDGSPKHPLYVASATLPTPWGGQ